MSGECNNCGDDHTEAACHEIRANELEAENARLRKALDKTWYMYRAVVYGTSCTKEEWLKEAWGE